jgi:DNA-binding GntR family transcriptional regulator
VQIQPLAQGSLSVRAYLTLREALIAGNFKPGQRLLMQDLADQLGTSVTPVREACLRLVSERGLELRSGRFVTIPELTLSRYMEIRTIRMALEGLAAEIATDNVDETDIERLSDIHTKFEKADRAGISEKAIRLNREFHFVVYQLSGMEMLISHIESLWISMGPILNVFYNEAINAYVGAEEHLHLIDALRRRDRKKARAAIERDILRGGQNIIRMLTEKRDALSSA